MIHHLLGGELHTPDTLANMNTKITDANLDDSGDPRTPLAHAVDHQEGGADEIDLTGLSGTEIRLRPKVASTGAEGTIFYSSVHKAVYVGTT